MYRSVEKKMKGKLASSRRSHFPWPPLVQVYSRVRPPPTLGGAETRIGLRFFEKGCSFMRRSSAPSTVWYLSSYFKFLQAKTGSSNVSQHSFLLGRGAQALSNKNVKNPSFFFPKWEERSGTLIFPQNSRLFPLLIFLWYIIGAFF